MSISKPHLGGISLPKTLQHFRLCINTEGAFPAQESTSSQKARSHQEHLNIYSKF